MINHCHSSSSFLVRIAELVTFKNHFEIRYPVEEFIYDFKTISNPFRKAYLTHFSKGIPVKRRSDSDGSL